MNQSLNQPKKREFRYRRYYVDESTVIGLLQLGANIKNGDRIQDVVLFPVLDIPKGAGIITAHWEPSYRGFVITIEHPSFDPVEPGFQVPMGEDVLGGERILIRKDEKGHYKLAR